MKNIFALLFKKLRSAKAKITHKRAMLHISASLGVDNKCVEKYILNQVRYKKANPDIIKSGINPTFHFLNFGNTEVREASPAFPNSTSINRKILFKEVYISSNPNTDGTYLYRCLFPSLAEECSASFSRNDSLTEIIKKLIQSERLIFSRPEPNTRSLYLLKLANQLGIRITIDIDDLVFPRFAQDYGAVRSKVSSEKASRTHSVYKSTLFHYADDYICSTSEIKNNIIQQIV